MKASSINGVELSEAKLDEMLDDKGVAGQPEVEESFFHLFKYPNLRQRSVLLFFSWFVNSATYFGLSWNTPNLGGDEFLNFAIAGLVELPATAIVFFTLNVWGRRIILCTSMITAGAALIMTIVVPSGKRGIRNASSNMAHSILDTHYCFSRRDAVARYHFGDGWKTRYHNVSFNAVHIHGGTVSNRDTKHRCRSLFDLW